MSFPFPFIPFSFLFFPSICCVHAFTFFDSFPFSPFRSPTSYLPTPLFPWPFLSFSFPSLPYLSLPLIYVPIPSLSFPVQFLSFYPFSSQYPLLPFLFPLLTAFTRSVLPQLPFLSFPFPLQCLPLPFSHNFSSLPFRYLCRFYPFLFFITYLSCLLFPFPFSFNTFSLLQSLLSFPLQLLPLYPSSQNIPSYIHHPSTFP